MQPDEMKIKGFPVKLAFYMTGSYAKILRRCVDFLDWEATAICPNFQAYTEAKKEPRLGSVDYLYGGFNEAFDRVDVAKFCKEYTSINLSEVLLVDKAHFKKKSGDYQLRYVCAMGEQIAAVFKRTRPDYVLFPIIETIDAMLAYRLAQHFGIRPIISSHARFTGRYFFSDSHRELLPNYTGDVAQTEADAAWAKQFVEKYRASPGPFNIKADIPVAGVYEDFGHDLGVVERLLQNIRLKSGVERHNQLINLWISLQIRFEVIFLAIRRVIFRFIERFYIRPKAAPAEGYDFFPLHFSPESSINVPAPFYIDQVRILDKILLERSGNRVLVLKEHPAMYGSRPRGFFRAFKSRPFVWFVSRHTPSIQLIRSASTVYSVTGTACLEAFLLGVNWVQFGNNYLSDWVRQRRERSQVDTPLEFIRDVLSVSKEFVLYSPGRSFSDDQILFSKANVERICDHLKFHVEQSSRIEAS